MENNNKIKDENVRNKKYDIQLNGKLKEWFVNLGQEASQETYTTYDNVMRKISHYEMNWEDGKDLYLFTRDEILNMLQRFSSSSPNTLNVYLSIIRNYIDLAIEQNYIKTNINMANNITYNDLVELVSTSKKDRKFVVADDFYDRVQHEVRNLQDQAKLLLVFEGIKGKDNSELQNLKLEDIDFDNRQIKVIRDGEELSVTISPMLTNILYRAKDEKWYFMHNGKKEKSVGGYTRELFPADESPYLLRPYKSVGQNIKGNTLQFQVLRICNVYLNMPFVTPSSIFLSGVIYKLKQCEEELGEELRLIDVTNYIDKWHLKLNNYQTFTAYKELKDKIAGDL